MLTRTSACLERIVLQGNCAALSLPGPDHSPPNIWSRHEERPSIFWKGMTLGFSSFSFTSLCVTEDFLVSLLEFDSTFVLGLVWFFLVKYYYLNKLCQKDCVTTEHACVVLVEFKKNLKNKKQTKTTGYLLHYHLRNAGYFPTCIALPYLNWEEFGVENNSDRCE